MDELVLAATVLVFLALLEVIITSRLVQKGQTQRAETIDHYARWMYPLTFVVLLVFSLKL
jgi:cadmium resistance protein CadD (predicted permease)